MRFKSNVSLEIARKLVTRVGFRASAAVSEQLDRFAWNLVNVVYKNYVRIPMNSYLYDIRQTDGPVLAPVSPSIFQVDRINCL